MLFIVFRVAGFFFLRVLDFYLGGRLPGLLRMRRRELPEQAYVKNEEGSTTGEALHSL